MTVQTMQPVLLYGRYEWDRNRLPLDEFDSRLQSVRRVMVNKGWQGLVVHGDSQENSLLCYLTGLIPNQRWGLALIGTEGAPRLIVPVGPRDLPPQRERTWIQDVRATTDAAGALTQWLGERLGASSAGRIGFADLGRMRFDIAGKALDACRDRAEVEDASPVLAELTRAKRPREIALLRLAYRVLSAALDEVARVGANGGEPRKSLLAGERIARLAGAQDVRVLCGANDGALRPVDSRWPAPSQRPASLYLALRLGGYWAEVMTIMGGAPSPAELDARRTLDAIAASARAGVSCRDLLRPLAADRWADAANPLLGVAVRRAGLSLDSEAWLPADEMLVENGVYTFAMGSVEAGSGQRLLASRTVVANATGAEILWPVAAPMAAS